MYKHLAIKATCSRLRLNYACGKAPLSLTIMANAFFGIEQFRPQRKLLLEKIEHNASERFAEALSVGTDVDATSDNCTC